MHDTKLQRLALDQLATVTGGDGNPPSTPPWPDPNKVCPNGVDHMKVIGGISFPVGPSFNVDLGPFHAGGGQVNIGGYEEIVCK